MKSENLPRNYLKKHTDDWTDQDREEQDRYLEAKIQEEEEQGITEDWSDGDDEPTFMEHAFLEFLEKTEKDNAEIKSSLHGQLSQPPHKPIFYPKGLLNL
jgi:hypothetical protein